MARTRVLVVDDSAAVRRIVAEVLAAEPDLDVVTAASGPLALMQLDRVAPDVVTLDVDMFGMSGLEVLRRLRAERPSLPVIMFSALTTRGAAETIDALLLGASDYVAKPSNAPGGEAAIASVREQLLPRIRQLVRPRPAPPPPPPGEPRSPGAVAAVVVAASTGGPAALLRLLPALPADLEVPVLVVQHMPATFTTLLAEGLARPCGLRVAEATDGATVGPGRVWLARGGLHLEVARVGPTRVEARLTGGPPEQSCRPAADVLFRSAASAWGAGALAIVLTGMGQDGLRGSEAIRAAGGAVLAQDEASSVVWGMPGFVAKAGLADAVLPLDRLAGEVLRRVRAGADRC